MQRLARKLAGSTDAEDIAQDAFAHAFRSLHALRDESAFRSWVCGIAAGLSRRLYRRKNRRHSLMLERIDEPARHWDDLVPAEATLQLKEVSKRLSRLRTRQRDVLWLHRLEGRTNAETARLMGVSVSSVKRWIGQIDRRLKGCTASLTAT